MPNKLMHTFFCRLLQQLLLYNTYYSFGRK